MKVNKLLNLIIILCSIQYSNCNAQVSIEVKANGEYFVQCNDQNKIFKNT